MKEGSDEGHDRERNVWQPVLEGREIGLTPLREEDFEPLFQAASDPAIWAMHPVSDRYLRPQFEIYFRSGMESGGALVVRERATGAIVGSSRFCRHDIRERSVEIGYTFLTTRCWGTGMNRELKELVLGHAFLHVERVNFVVGVNNLRSRRAVEKLGARCVRQEASRDGSGAVRDSVVYEISGVDWRRGRPA